MPSSLHSLTQLVLALRRFWITIPGQWNQIKNLLKDQIKIFFYSFIGGYNLGFQQNPNSDHSTG